MHPYVCMYACMYVCWGGIGKGGRMYACVLEGAGGGHKCMREVDFFVLREGGSTTD